LICWKKRKGAEGFNYNNTLGRKKIRDFQYVFVVINFIEDKILAP